MSKFFEINPDEDSVKFTQEGIVAVIQMYDMYLNGTSVEQIENAFELDAGDPGDESEHIEFRVLMAMGDASGVFDKYDQFLEDEGKHYGFEV